MRALKFAAFGVLRLGVVIDLVLLVGALGLFAQDYLREHARRQASLA